MEDKIKEAMSVMKKAYDVYCEKARQSLAKDLTEDYWHWRGIAEGTRRSWELLEGTRRSWELLEEMFGQTDVYK